MPGAQREASPTGARMTVGRKEGSRATTGAAFLERPNEKCGALF